MPISLLGAFVGLGNLEVREAGVTVKNLGLDRPSPQLSPVLISNMTLGE